MGEIAPRSGIKYHFAMRVFFGLLVLAATVLIGIAGIAMCIGPLGNWANTIVVIVAGFAGLCFYAYLDTR